MRDRLAAEDVRSGFLLDGYPRTLDQGAVLDGLLAEQDRRLDAAVVLDADPEELLQRLLHRAELEHRSDDTEEVIRHRLDVYAEQTVPLIAAYDDRGLVIRVDGVGEPDEVSRRILDIASALIS
jgi:adenylate kinase